jgi:hypothetical protein
MPANGGTRAWQGNRDTGVRRARREERQRKPVASKDGLACQHSMRSRQLAHLPKAILDQRFAGFRSQTLHFPQAELDLRVQPGFVIVAVAQRSAADDR